MIKLCQFPVKTCPCTVIFFYKIRPIKNKIIHNFPSFKSYMLLLGTQSWQKSTCSYNNFSYKTNYVEYYMHSFTLVQWCRKFDDENSIYASYITFFFSHSQYFTWVREIFAIQIIFLFKQNSGLNVIFYINAFIQIIDFYFKTLVDFFKSNSSF